MNGTKINTLWELSKILGLRKTGTCSLYTNY